MRDGCHCHVNITIKRYDGIAHLSKWIRYPRAPIEGDCLVTVQKIHQLRDLVKKVTLVPLHDLHAPTAWVDLEDDENFDFDWGDDPDWGFNCREKLRSGMEPYLVEGFQLD